MTTTTAPPTTKRQLDPIAQAIGLLVRKKRLEAMLTQESVAKAMGCRVSMISNYERGVHKPSGDVIARLADAIGCTADELLDYERERVRAEPTNPL